MIAVRLPNDLQKRLDHLSEITHRPRTFYVKEAIKKYLEDVEDYYVAVERLVDPKAKYYSSEEVERQLGL